MGLSTLIKGYQRKLKWECSKQSRITGGSVQNVNCEIPSKLYWRTEMLFAYFSALRGKGPIN